MITELNKFLFTKEINPLTCPNSSGGNSDLENRVTILSILPIVRKHISKLVLSLIQTLYFTLLRT
ncbi:MAG: hypothetical protein AABY49_02820 [Planctomycetota bacterium]